MRFHTYFKTASYLLVFSAFLSLALTGELEAPYIAIITLGLAASLMQEKFDLSPLSKWIIAVSIPFLIVDFLFISKDILYAFTHLLILLTNARLLSLRTDADYNQLFLLTFFDLLAASALTINLSFAFTFTMYLVSVTWVLLLFHIKKEVEGRIAENKEQALEGTVTIPFFLGIGGVAVLSLVITLGIFFILPRAGVGLFSKKQGKVMKTSGFGDKVDFGDIGALTPDPTTVMRVELPDFEKGLGSIYLRGTVLDSFNGVSWKRERSKLEAVNKEDNDFVISKGAKNLVRQEVILDPIDSRVVFGMEKVVRLSGRFQTLFTDSYKTVYLPVNPSSRFQYTVYSDTRVPNGKELDADRGPYNSKVIDLYAKLPSGSVRVKELASSITASSEGTYQKARAIEDYLKKNYSYTLSPNRDVSLPPVEDFLFKSKGGYCDHFSTAMALLLREVDVPARLVTGYVTTEWNDLGRFYTVRQRNAHSWVEVYFPSHGWVSFDPTPSAMTVEENITVTAISRYIAYIRLKWDRYIINFTFQDQVNAAKEAKRRTELGRDTFIKAISALRAKVGRVWLPLLISVLSISMIYYLLTRRWRGRYRSSLSRENANVPFYQEMLKILAKRGIIKTGNMTPREFAEHAFAEKGGSYRNVLEITKSFEMVRYGGMTLSKKEREEINMVLEGFRKAK
ncbi:MAG: TGc protein [Deltaproteobacteria bacterium]|nr:TGc protein [Deltaproteobacteria bacterium]